MCWNVQASQTNASAMSSGKLGKLSEENIQQAREDLKKSSELASQHASAVSLSAGGVWTAASQADFGDMGKSVEKLLTEGAASMGVLSQQQEIPKAELRHQLRVLRLLQLPVLAPIPQTPRVQRARPMCPLSATQPMLCKAVS